MSACGDKAHKASGEQFLKEEIESMVSDLKEIKLNEGNDALSRTKKKKLERTEKHKLLEKRTRLKNAIVEARLMEAAKMADQKYNDPALGLHAMISGSNSPFKGNLKSAHAVQMGLIHKYTGGLLHDLRKANLLPQFNNMKGDFELQVTRALSELNKKRPDLAKLNASKDAIEIARIMHKYQRASTERANRAGAWIELREGYVTRQNHSPQHMIKRGKKAWKDFVRNRLDWKTMEVPVKSQEAFLEEAYLSIKSGIRITDDIDDVTKAFKGPSSLAKRTSASRVLLFKDADSWFEYDQEFGYGSLRESYMQDIFRMARATAAIDKFGTNPEAMLDRVVGKLSEKYRNDDKRLKRLQGRVSGVTLKAALSEITGDVNMGASATSAQIFSAHRALITMARLGGSWVSAWADIPFMASNRMFQGSGFFQSWADALSAPVQGMSSGEQRAFADLIGAGLEGQLGDFMSRMHAQDEIAGKTSKMLHYFFKLNLLGPWTASNKRGITMIVSRDLARNSTKSWEKLPDDLRNLFKSYDLTADKWAIASKATMKGPDGRLYLVPEKLDGFDLKKLPKAFKGLSENKQKQIVEETQESLLALFSNEADHAVPSAGARERGVLRQGYRPGTPEGEAIRYIAQFKSFGVSAITRVLGRQVYGRGARTLPEALSKGFGANLGLVNAIVVTSFMGYLVLQAKEMMAGRSPKPLTPELFLRSVVQGGGFGLYGDFMLSEAHKYGGTPLDQLAGPGITGAFDAAAILSKMRTEAMGGDAPWETEAVTWLRGHTPGMNLFYTKQVTDYLIWYHLFEAANPGYLRRIEKRIKEQGQEMWLNPNDTIKRGGGFR